MASAAATLNHAGAGATSCQAKCQLRDAHIALLQVKRARHGLQRRAGECLRKTATRVRSQRPRRRGRREKASAASGASRCTSLMMPKRRLPASHTAWLHTSECKCLLELLPAGQCRAVNRRRFSQRCIEQLVCCDDAWPSGERPTSCKLHVGLGTTMRACMKNM